MLKVAMISKWHVHAEGYARSFNKEADACVTCVWDENPDRGREWAKQLEVPFVENYDDVLARTDVDAVAIWLADQHACRSHDPRGAGAQAYLHRKGDVPDDGGMPPRGEDD